MPKVAVIGAGPAGIAAAIQLVRSGICVQVFEHGRIGGTIRNAGWIENYPGFPGGISGRRLADLMEEQLLGYVDNVIVSTAEQVERAGSSFRIRGMDFGGVILCTGTAPKRAGIPGEEEAEKAGHLRYGIADMDRWGEPEHIGVVGGGESSLDMALTLAEEGYRVTLIHRSEPGGIKALLDLARDEKAITWVRSEVRGARMHGNTAVLALDGQELAFDQVVVAVGREAALPKFVGFDRASTPPGLLTAGDASRGGLGQVANAVGDGVEAARMLADYLRSMQ